MGQFAVVVMIPANVLQHGVSLSQYIEQYKPGRNTPTSQEHKQIKYSLRMKTIIPYLPTVVLGKQTDIFARTGDAILYQSQ